MFRTGLTLLPILLAACLATAQEPAGQLQNKTVPTAIEKQVRQALAHYPELTGTTIRFVFTDRLNTSIMAARPTFGSLFRKKENRVYNILINPTFKLGNGDTPSVGRIPDSVMVGWLGHELGHIMDYEQKSRWGIMAMGVSYTLSKNYIRKAERRADRHAVDRRMADYLIAKKSFILNHDELPQAYRDRIEALYLSPDDIRGLAAGMYTRY